MTVEIYRFMSYGSILSRKILEKSKKLVKIAFKAQVAAPDPTIADALKHK